LKRERYENREGESAVEPKAGDFCKAKERGGGRGALIARRERGAHSSNQPNPTGEVIGGTVVRKGGVGERDGSQYKNKKKASGVGGKDEARGERRTRN